MSSRRKILRVTLDFDGTLTASDTLEELASVAYSSPGAPDGSLKPWSYFVDGYMRDSKAHAANYEPAEEDRKTVAQEVAWLGSLKTVEDASWARAERERLFEHVSKEDINSAAREKVASGQVTLRPGWQELMKRIATLGDDKGGASVVEVLSVNWSSQWIRSCMKGAAEAKGEKHLAASFEDESTATTERNGFAIFANEICGFADSAVIRIQTSRDKLQCFVSNRALSDSNVDRDSSVNVYVGDSSTDLECLLAAHVGLCMRDKKMGSGQQQLSKTFERLNIAVGHLAAFDEHNARDTREACEKGNGSDQIVRSRVWWINDFHEVEAWLARWGPDICKK